MTSSHAIVTPMPTKNQQIFASKGVINFQMEFGLADQISWGDNSHINDHKINSDICLQ